MASSTEGPSSSSTDMQPLSPGVSKPPTYTLITGASSGIGLSLALLLSSPPYSHTVILTSRTLPDLPSPLPPTIIPITLDVTSSASIRAALAQITQLTSGRLDNLINNAGRNYTVPSTEVEVREARATFDANFFGPLELVQAFAPLLVNTAYARRAEAGPVWRGRSGWVMRLLIRLASLLEMLTLGLVRLPVARPQKPAIVQIGSLAGVMPYVFGGVYNASKAALHSYSDALRLELRPFGVDVVTVVTGGVKSNIARTKRVLRPGSLYKGIEEVYVKRQTHSQQVGMESDVYARRVAREIWGDGGRRRSDRIWEGGMVWLAWFAVTWCPRWVMEMWMTKNFGLDRIGPTVNNKRRED